MEKYPNAIIMPSSKSPLNWKQGREKSRNPNDDNKREVVSERQISKNLQQLESNRKMVTDVTEQKDWHLRASVVEKAAEERDILNFWNWKCSRLGNSKYIKTWECNEGLMKD